MINFEQPLITFLRSVNHNQTGQFVYNVEFTELLIRQARRANLLARVAFLLKELELFHKLPKKGRDHLQNALTVALANERSVNVEIREIYKLLSRQRVPIIILKGSAYIWASKSASKGRVFADVDIMVLKKDIDLAEKIFAQHGWLPSKAFDCYYQKYYRTWMHEIPPLKHKRRGTELDVHHTIIPPTSKLKPDPNEFWTEAQLISEFPGLMVLSSVDMILHSATHLFHEGEFDNGLRDISDLDLLLSETMENDADWEGLIKRAKKLGLCRPLFYALRYTSIFLKTPVPEKIIRKINCYSPGFLGERIMDCLMLRALMPNHSSCDDLWTGLARWLLYIRSHWLRMPLYLLVPHLLRKSWMRLTGKSLD